MAQPPDLESYTRLQRGLVTRQQCLAAGLTGKAVECRVRSGRWVRVHPGVLQTTPGRDDWTTRALAALLRIDSGGVAADAALCGAGAAHLWGLVREPPDVVEVVVPYRRTVAAPDGVRVRRSLRWDDLVDEMAYPWRTTLPATVLDVATGCTPVGALGLVARAVQRELVTPSELLREVTARGGHRHSRLLRAALVDVAQGAESGAEVLFARDVERAHGLPPSRRQSPSQVGAARRHDVEFPGQGVIVEVDGRAGHEEWADRVRDGRRDRQLLTDGRLTTRVFWTDVAVTPCATAAEIGAILRTRGWRGMPRRCRRDDCSVPARSL